MLPKKICQMFMAWVLSTCALAGADADAFRRVPLTVPVAGKHGFAQMPPTVTGIQFTNLLPEIRFRTNQILLNGSGVAAGDVDNDGLCDLYFGRLNGSNALYRNLGNWKFENITASAGVACANFDSTGVAFGDLDGDRDLDLVVNTIGNGTRLFLNDGRAHFSEITAGAPLNARRGGMSMALGDLDGDGYLDLYVANYRTLGLMDMPSTRFWLVKSNGQQVVSTVNGRPVSEPDLANRFVVPPTGGIEELGEADVLHRNAAGKQLVPVPFEAAFSDEDGRPLAHPPFEWGLSVIIRDLNEDGLPDIFVCNDFDGPDRLWLNQDGGKFKAAPRLALRKLSFFSMGADVADINRDGFDDIFVADMLSRDHVRRMNFLPERKMHHSAVGEMDNRPQYARNTLFLSRGDGTYAEIGALAGVQASEWTWCPVFLDVDLDGWEDLLITNGHERDARNMDKLDEIKRLRAAGKIQTTEQTFDIRRIFPRLATPNLAYRNNGDLTFSDAGPAWSFDLPGVSHGMALADLDNDGDLDVIINNLNAAPFLLRNESAAPRLAVRLRGRGPNTAGIGARITVTGGPVNQQQEMICGGRYLSCDQAVRVFAAGQAANQLTISVRWRNGGTSVVTGAVANSLYEIMEPAPSATGTKPARNPEPPVFADASALLKHHHVDEPFDDFSVQPLLPFKLSQLGPGVAWHDVDADGWDDAIIGSGKGGFLAVFRNEQSGKFTRMTNAPFAIPAARDQTAVLAWPKGPGHTALLVGSATWEQADTNASMVTEFDLRSRMLLNRFPGSTSSAGSLALGDLDSDGDLDLFIGGRALPALYPSPARSQIYRNLGGRWQLDAENSAALSAAGSVSGAVFSDVTGDGHPDLVLACEWGSVRVYSNHRGRLVDATEQLGLAQYSGWWNGVATGDFDNDGRLDIAASNWGRNTPYQTYREHPLSLHYGQFNADPAAQMIEAHFEPALNKIVPNRGMDSLAKVIPGIRARYSTYDAFAHASVSEILGEMWSEAKTLQATWLESTVFLNRGTNFVARALPTMAQAAPAFGICVADANGDGNDDLFLAQNFFATPPETPRCDAGLGLWLFGNGSGGFVAVSAQESGVRIFGEQRGAAVGDYNQDGRVDLLVGQNGNETKLFRNERARPGLRVKVAGPPSNPQGVGTVLRLVGSQRLGPAREVQAGSGYWSQNSAIQVLALPGAERMEVRWPGGGTTNIFIPANVRELTISRQ